MCSRVMLENVAGKSSGPRTSTDRTVTFNLAAASWIALRFEVFSWKERGFQR